MHWNSTFAVFDFCQDPNKVCLCGALAGEVLALPEEMRVEVKAFMRSHQDWLEDIFLSGREIGESQFKEMPANLARTFSARCKALY